MTHKQKPQPEKFVYVPLPDLGPYFTFRKEVRSYHLTSARDRAFCMHADKLYMNCEASHNGGGTDKRALCVVAPAGSGKTTLVNYYIDLLPYFRPSIDAYGDEVSPILRIKLPPGSTSKSAMLYILRKMGIDDKKYTSKPEPDLPEIVLGHMKELGIKYLVVDELQHGVRGTQTGFIKKMQDALKTLISSDDWPLHAIFIGTPEVLPILEDQQVDRRTDILRLAPLEAKYASFVDNLIKEIIVDAAGMTFSFDAEDMVTARLMHAANYVMGTAILMLQETCFATFLAGEREISIADLRTTYLTKTGCSRRDNVFEAPEFLNIKPNEALADLLKQEEKSDDDVTY
ncbi:AAA family ATPase [Rhizobium leguminosarum bv. viciae]|uniref:ATP-binding protein n=1 Tax=Rhizobium leguminosarum TaxID=384 RepID=UPI001440E5FC|nr:ATP-binding protein [Rhizobium leguminosarum]NKL74260.1 AAA family ATPase [Rhizobium leguminosarum bv. viciae]